ncbi:DUF4350 domain-containing protein [Ramlibacter albus]|uniref:DUF4350 domain-containing protein n=1 Tax=Ramlibacter albus TaxID=2079448 RepID=A0A923M4E5_9BURK|nr:DUF4350 domain-containing protein [Ramlibacter albus]MBC5763698.1 DUF4350 domain-containing protein [Ramlibacter albus]
MSREAITRWVFAALAIAVAVWLVNATEWAEVEVPRPPRGEAARNPWFAASLLVRSLGGRAERQLNLEAMPPRDIRLVLDARPWHLFPERAQQLQQWVESGGNLVLPATVASDQALRWIPVAFSNPPKETENAPRTRSRVPAEEQGCRTLRERAPPAAAATEPLKVCAYPYWQILSAREGTAPLWALEGPRGIEVLRVAVGRGTVTVHGPWGLLHNRDAVRHDHALVVADTLQLRRGSVVWFVGEESREPLLPWLWNRAWPALLMGLLALAAWVWRSAVRFGPVGAAPATQRRSMREQVAGTAAFLRRHAPGALQDAQVRALAELARTRVAGFTSLGDPASLARVAKAAHVPAGPLADALRGGAPTPKTLPARLEVVEHARRRLQPRNTDA